MSTRVMLGSYTEIFGAEVSVEQIFRRCPRSCNFKLVLYFRVSLSLADYLYIDVKG